MATNVEIAATAVLKRQAFFDVVAKLLPPGMLVTQAVNLYASDADFAAALVAKADRLDSLKAIRSKLTPTDQVIIDSVLDK